MPTITMTYGGYTFSPVPSISINKEFQKSSDGIIRGSIFKLGINGTLYAPVGGLSSIMGLQSDMRSGLYRDGDKFELTCDGSPLLTCYPRINGPTFSPSPNNWVITCDYSVELEFDDEPQPTSGFGVDPEFTGISPPFISDFSESWSVDVADDKAFFNNFGDSNPTQLRLSHNISAVGKRRYTGGGLEKPAWEQARSYVVGYLGYNSGFAGASGVLNIGVTSLSGYNHVRSNSVDVTNGSYSVVENWILTSGTNAVEDFTVDVRKGIDSDLTTVSIQGTIQGLETRSYGSAPGDFNISTSKFAAASGYWLTIKDSLRIYPRAQAYAADTSTRSINVIPVSKSVGYGPANGVITYNYEYNDRVGNCIANAVSESIVITDVNPIDVFTEIIIPGRANGPILQDIGTVGSRKRDISIDVVVRPATGCGSTSALFTNNPSTDVNTIFLLFYAELTGAHNQVFLHNDTSNWEPKTGHYTATKGWTYGEC